MKLVHYYLPGEGALWGLMEFDRVYPLASDAGSGGAFLASMLQWPEPALTIAESYATVAHGPSVSFDEMAANDPSPYLPHLLPPIDLQEVWAAGVTYQRSKVARMEESAGAARFYDAVYEAARPELFFKGSASRVSGPNAPVRIRKDAQWNVPEPEVALLLTPRMKIAGYTIGNDVSSRDIEGENPLYLPQAKVYRQACGLGPVVWLENHPQEHRPFDIELRIERGGEPVFSGQTSTINMKRRFVELVEWLARDSVFPHGAFLLTGTGIVPGDEFSLASGDLVIISVSDIGTLRNPVVQG